MQFTQNFSGIRFIFIISKRNQSKLSIGAWNPLTFGDFVVQVRRDIDCLCDGIISCETELFNRSNTGTHTEYGRLSQE